MRSWSEVIRAGWSRRLGGRWAPLGGFAIVLIAAAIGFVVAGEDRVSLAGVAIAFTSGFAGLFVWILFVGLFSVVRAPADMHRLESSTIQALEAKLAVRTENDIIRGLNDQRRAGTIIRESFGVDAEDWEASVPAADAWVRASTGLIERDRPLYAPVLESVLERQPTDREGHSNRIRRVRRVLEMAAQGEPPVMPA